MHPWFPLHGHDHQLSGVTGIAWTPDQRLGGAGYIMGSTSQGEYVIATSILMLQYITSFVAKEVSWDLPEAKD